MTVTVLRSALEDSGNNRPARPFGVQKLALAAEDGAGLLVDVRNFPICTISWEDAHVGLTMKVFGSYDDAAGVKFPIADADGVPLVIDLAQGADGSSFLLDNAANFDKLEFIVSSSVTADFYIGCGA